MSIGVRRRDNTLISAIYYFDLDVIGGSGSLDEGVGLVKFILTRIPLL